MSAMEGERRAMTLVLKVRKGEEEVDNRDE